MNEIKLYQLSNGIIDLSVCNLGCTIVSIFAPDKQGTKDNIVAGFKTLDEYKNNEHYFGCTVGRFANRIANGNFQIEGKEFQLSINNEPNHLHGGFQGFHMKIWQVEQKPNSIIMHYTSKDGEEGYPGNLTVSVKFYFEQKNKLVIQYTAETDKPTIVNLCNHSYFNLSGFEQSNIYNHSLKVNSQFYTKKNINNVPTGEISSVRNTPFDFQNFKNIGADIHTLVEDMGYDINFVLNTNGNLETACAELYEPNSGRLLKVYSSKPGLQLYTANWWNGLIIGNQNKPYQKHGAVALETQFYPDSPNHQPYFSQSVLNPNQQYNHTTIYQFLYS